MHDLLLCVEECQTILPPQRIVTTTLFVRGNLQFRCHKATSRNRQ